MAVSLSTARWMAPAAFLFNFAAQQYGMLSSPNMKDINDANLSFFSPQPYFIAGFFFPQQIFQIAYMYKLWRLDSKRSEDESRELEQMVDYAPYFTVGNLCIAVWMIFWNSAQLKAAHVFVTINTFSQLYYMIAKLKPMNRRSIGSVLTHIVVKTFAGIGVLDFLHNGSVAFFKDHPATVPVKVLTGLGFAAASAMSDWIFGACLVYDLVAMSVGQSGNWRGLLGAYAAGSAAIVAAKNWLR
ncbi:MAG: hypothetical protein M1819_000401 [Sarea resinae]|nr:MAG: hypothetical protein M1819_000401 [Sarea resinae]